MPVFLYLYRFLKTLTGFDIMDNLKLRLEKMGFSQLGYILL